MALLVLENLHWDVFSAGTNFVYYVIPPFGVVLPVYPPDYRRAHSVRGGRADKPQHHDKKWNNNIIMFITVDWSLLGNLRAREGGAVKLFQIRQATLASARVKLGERRCLETLWRTKGEAG